MVRTRKILYQPNPVKPWTVSGYNGDGEDVSYTVILHDRGLPSAATPSPQLQINVRWTSSDLGLTGECIRLQPYAKLFKIQGNFLIDWKGSPSVLNMSFEIVTGSGREDYEGIRGGGKIAVHLFPGSKVCAGQGTCAFENMNRVGLSLE